jgi:hypothetical protein
VNFVVELALLLADMFMDREERCNHAEELMIVAQQLADLIADLVLDIPANGHKPGSRDEYRADLLTFLTLDFDFSIPTDAYQFGKTSSVILIALVHANRQGGVRMASVDADHR